MGVGRGAQRETADERPDRQREAQELGRDGGAQHDEQGDQGEELARARARHPIQQAREAEPCAHEERHQGEHATPRGQAHGRPALRGGRRQQRHREQEGHDAQVLEQQDSDRELAVRRVELAAIGEQPHDERRARHGDERAEHERARQRNAERARDGAHDAECERHLQAACQQRAAPQEPHPLHRELQADLEEQEDDTQLGELGDALRVAHDPEAARAHHRTCGEEADDGRQAQALDHPGPDRRDGDQQQQLEQKRLRVHSPPPGTRGLESRSRRDRPQRPSIEDRRRPGERGHRPRRPIVRVGSWSRETSAALELDPHHGGLANQVGELRVAESGLGIEIDAEDARQAGYAPQQPLGASSDLLVEIAEGAEGVDGLVVEGTKLDVARHARASAVGLQRR
jgi:hypothetical protein